MLAFQPVVCAATGIVDYFECLLRMRDEKGSVVPAGEFISVIEELGLIGRIDRYVLGSTLEELATDPDVRLGFNISGLTACDRPWLRLLISQLRHRPELARRLVVEITETAALSDIEESALCRHAARARLPRRARRFRRRTHLAAASSGLAGRHSQDRWLPCSESDEAVPMSGLSSSSAGTCQGFWAEHDSRMRRERRGGSLIALRRYRIFAGLSFRSAFARTRLAHGRPSR
jgi:hypothetical protein